jgi:hypothetical protein
VIFSDAARAALKCRRAAEKSLFSTADKAASAWLIVSAMLEGAAAVAASSAKDIALKAVNEIARQVKAVFLMMFISFVKPLKVVN